MARGQPQPDHHDVLRETGPLGGAAGLGAATASRTRLPPSTVGIARWRSHTRDLAQQPPQALQLVLHLPQLLLRLARGALQPAVELPSQELEARQEQRQATRAAAAPARAPAAP